MTPLNMKRIIHRLCILCAVAVSFGTLQAQKANSLYFLEQSPGIARSNPAINPSYSGFGIGISSLSIYVQSDLALNQLIQVGPDGQTRWFLNPDADRNVFLESIESQTQFRSGTHIDYFSLGIKLGDKGYLRFHSGLSIETNAGIPKDLFRMIIDGMDANASVTSFDLTQTQFDISAYSISGMGFSSNFGEKVIVGANINYLRGLSDIRMGFDELRIDASEEQWDVYSKGYLQMAGPDQIDFRYDEDGYLDGFEQKYSNSVGQNLSSIVNALPNAGSGFSFDLGVLIKPVSFLKLSASLTDIGSIRWNSKHIQKAASDGHFTYDGMDLNASETEESSIQEEVKDLLRFEKVQDYRSYRSRLNSKLNFGAEAGIIENKMSLGVLSQTTFTDYGDFQDLMLSANFKPGSLIQTAFTYSLLHGELSSFGAAVNMKLLFLNIFAAADYIPASITPQGFPINNAYFNGHVGLNFMF